MSRNLICSQKVLNDALDLVVRATSSKSTLPVLNNVLLEARKDRLFLTTTNLEIGIEHWVDVIFEKEGKITVPVKLLLQYISLLKDDAEIQMTFTEDNTLKLDTKGSKTEIKGISADEFPLIPKVEKETELLVDSEILHGAINQTVFASALDETRPVLAGVYFNFKQKDAKVVATDSYRLAEKTIEITGTKEVKIIVPGKTISELGRIISKYKEKVKIITAKNQVLFELSNLRLISRLIEGQYPPYEQIIPSKSEVKAIVNINEFATLIKRVNLFAQESASNIKIAIDKTGKIIVTAKTDQIGNEQAEISAKVEGESKEIAFNANYIIDALNNIGGEEVVLEVNNESSPGLLKPVKSQDYLYVIMPIKM